MEQTEQVEAGQDGNGQDAAGRATVRQVLIRSLEDAGLIWPARIKVAARAEIVERLVEYLAYMSPAALRVLRDLVLRNPQGPGRNQWPSELAIRQWAEGLEKRPFEHDPIVASWLASIEGPKAEARGELVELFRFLRRARRPPGPVDRQKIGDEAERNRREMAQANARIANGTAFAGDAEWRTAWLADEARARGIVDAGRAKRGVAV